MGEHAGTQNFDDHDGGPGHSGGEVKVSPEAFRQGRLGWKCSGFFMGLILGQASSRATFYAPGFGGG